MSEKRDLDEILFQIANQFLRRNYDYLILAELFGR